uniref:Retrotransposon gag domain-containing protein n=1 Tax=Nicotiana tabacum TaxID=4097 RepID=A0A1S4D2H2_TOBAC|nr:PREDICTED: uncharacterized protein LOC107825297 [Nicotiana tabacum]
MGQTSTQDTIANKENDGVDLAAREAAQQEAARKIADETVNDDGDDAKQWLRSLPTRWIRKWEDMTKKFLHKYFSAAKIGKFIRIQMVFEAWERFKEIVRKCQHNGIDLWMQLQDFWDRLTLSSRRTLNTACGVPLMKKTLDEVVLILDELSKDANQWPTKSNDRRKLVGVHQVDSNTTMQDQLETMANEIRKMTLAKLQSEQQAACDFCGLGHPTHECQSSAEEVNAVGNFNRGNYQGGNNYNAMAQRHPGFSWSSPSGSLNSWAPGTLPSNIEKNPKKTIKVVSLRSGKTFVDLVVKDRPMVVNKQAETPIEKKGEEQKGYSSGVQKEIEESRHMSALPFPQKMKREKLDKCFGRFLEMLKQLYMNIPFIEVLT